MISIDPWLEEQMRQAGEAGLVEALILMREPPDEPWASDDGGRAQRVVAAAAKRLGEQAHTARFFPRANAAYLAASVRLLHAVFEDDDVAAASAVGLEPFWGPGR